MDNQNLNLRAYFLGQLTDDGLAETELQILSDASLEEKMYSVESDLMEDYLDETLAPDEKDLFDKNFLITAERRKRLDLLKLLKEHAQNIRRNKEIVSLKPEEKPTFLDSLKKLFSPNLKPAAILATVLVLAVGFSWIFFFYNAGQRDVARVENSVRELNRKDFSNPVEYQKFSNLTLTPGSLRSSGGKNNLTENNLTDTVFLRLTLPIEINSDKFYTAKLIKDGKPVLTLDQMHTYQNQTGREIRMLLPASELKKGEYQIELREENSSNENAKIFYTFTVQ